MYAAFAGASDKGFANPQEFQMRVEVFKENLQQLAELNANTSEFIVSSVHCPALVHQRLNPVSHSCPRCSSSSSLA